MIPLRGKMSFDITALGEILIDFTHAGFSTDGRELFEKNPGGAPANLLACISKLGLKTAFIGSVGDDIFGSFLIKTLESGRIDTSGLSISSNPTTLAFVSLDGNGERSFSFYRNPGADTDISIKPVTLEIIRSSRCFHFGSLSLTDEPSLSSTKTAIEAAKKAERIISYDPNLRLRLWPSADLAKERILSVMGSADIVKISVDELQFLTGESDLSRGSRLLLSEYNLLAIIVTLGAGGSYFCTEYFDGRVDAFNVCDPIDTTGAGDAYFGAFLYCILSEGEENLRSPTKEFFTMASVFANAAASLSTTRRGAIPAMPSYEEIKNLLRKHDISIQSLIQ
jgi:fructokinase